MASITGTAGADSLTGTDGADVIFGLQGNDTIQAGTHFGDFVFDTLRGGAGDDSIDITFGYGGLVFGDNGADTLTHNAGDGITLFEGGPGDDLIDGNVTDTAFAFAGYITATGGVNVSLAVSGPQAVGGGAGVDTLQRLDGLVGSSFNDTLTGGLNGNSWSRFGVLAGGPGNDLITTGGVGDTIQGGPGDDTIVGGFADDVLTYGKVFQLDAMGAPDYAATSGVNVDLAIAGPHSVGGGMGVDTITGIRHLVGSDFSDTLSGGAAAETLEGGAGDDALVGRQGADSFVGGAGADTIRGGQGDDFISGGDGNDWLSGDRGNDTLSGGTGADTFHSFSGAGIDRVLGFNAAEGDKVQLDPGTSWTVSQVGNDTVVDLGNGDQVVLAGVDSTTLPPGWIFAG